MRPDSWQAERTYSTPRWTFSPYFPRPGRLPPDMRASPARPVMPAPDEPSDEEPLRAAGGHASVIVFYQLFVFDGDIFSRAFDDGVSQARADVAPFLAGFVDLLREIGVAAAAGVDGRILCRVLGVVGLGLVALLL